MPETDQIYHALIMDRVRAPRHAGRPENYDAEAAGENPMCGDQVHVFVNRNGTQVSHDSRGCAIMVASADLMADAVAGLDAAQFQQLRSAFEAVVNTGAKDPSLGELNALAGVSEFRSRIKCATLPWSALAQALEGAE
jgi:nitrogen fixation protein NifU and related proteins